MLFKKNPPPLQLSSLHESYVVFHTPCSFDNSKLMRVSFLSKKVQIMKWSVAIYGNERVNPFFHIATILIYQTTFSKDVRLIDNALNKNKKNHQPPLQLSYLHKPFTDNHTPFSVVHWLPSGITVLFNLNAFSMSINDLWCFLSVVCSCKYLFWIVL